jgi:alkylation response protein AidB-like acyl-CoA dehydrogenase
MVRDGVRAGYAMTEPGVAGSDPTGLSTRAVRHDDGTWSVTGRKWFTSGAAGAELVLVVARSDESPSDGAPGGETEPGFTVLAVPTDSTGYTIERELDVLGAGGQYEIRFEGARVGADHVLGRPGDGLRLAGERLALGRTLRALRWVGQAQRATEMLAHRATARRIGNGTLAERQLVQKMLFEAELAVRGARALAGRAAEAVVREERATVEVGLAKVAAARALGTAVDGAVQVHGAEGLLDESGLPGLARVARSSRILDGADELHITTTARRLLREYGSTTTRLPT